jgi:single-strand DNA-binding protein
VSLNKAMIIGNLGRDPEMRYTSTGKAVTEFTVAVNRRYRGQNDDWQEETEWFRVVAWGPLAERTAENLRKGRKVYVEGRIQTRQWEDKDGQKRYTTELVASQVTSLDRAQRDGGDPGPGDAATGGQQAVSPIRGARQAGAGGGASAGAGGGAGSGEETYEDLDDLPF